MTTAMTESLTEVLNKQIANFGVLYVKLHHYHWFVKGSRFFELHAKFEELYDEAAGYLDELAERLLAIGGRPVSTMMAFLKTSSLSEAAGNETAQQMVDNLAGDLTTVLDELKQGMKAAEQADDDATADLLTGIRLSLEKHLWMLNAALG